MQLGKEFGKSEKHRVFPRKLLLNRWGFPLLTGNTKLSLPVFVDLAEILDVRTDDLLYDGISAERSSTIDEIVQILNTCTAQQLKIIKNILKTTKISLEQYL